MGNLVRIVAGIGGLTAAAWWTVRVLRLRRITEVGGGRPSYVGTFAILTGTAAVVAATLLL